MQGREDPNIQSDTSPEFAQCNSGQADSPWRISRELAESRLLQVVDKAQHFVRNALGKDSFLVGSLALGVFLEDSDVDLAIPVEAHELRQILLDLSRLSEFRGERKARSKTSRYLFCISIEGVHVDLNIMTPQDCHCLVQAMDTARKSMTDLERNSHTLERFRLKQANDTHGFDVIKLELYRRFCPELEWIPDFEIVQSLSEGNGSQYGDLRLPPIG